MAQFRHNPKIIESSDFAEVQSLHVEEAEDGHTYATIIIRLHAHKPYAHSPTQDHPAGHPEHGTPTHLHLYQPQPTLIEAKPVQAKEKEKKTPESASE